VEEKGFQSTTGPLGDLLPEGKRRWEFIKGGKGEFFLVGRKK